MSKSKTRAVRKFADLEPALRNANQGTPRGTAMIEASLRKYGAGRSILVDRKGRIIAGNHVVEGAASIGMEKIIVVPTDGTKLVVVQRTDLDADEKPAKELAVSDNRTSEVSLRWSPDILAGLSSQIDMDSFFDTDELDKIMDAVNGKESESEPKEKSYKLEHSRVECPHCRQSFGVIVDKDRHVVVES